MSDGDTSPRDDGGDEFAPQWRVLTTRWRRGRHVGLAHLLLTPLLVWALSYPITWWEPSAACARHRGRTERVLPRVVMRRRHAPRLP